MGVRVSVRTQALPDSSSYVLTFLLSYGFVIHKGTVVSAY